MPSLLFNDDDLPDAAAGKPSTAIIGGSTERGN
jgi:hypothetical protein